MYKLSCKTNFKSIINKIIFREKNRKSLGGGISINLHITLTEKSIKNFNGFKTGLIFQYLSEFKNLKYEISFGLMKR